MRPEFEEHFEHGRLSVDTTLATSVARPGESIRQSDFRRFYPLPHVQGRRHKPAFRPDVTMDYWSITITPRK